MRNKLQIITETWHKRYSSQPKIKVQVLNFIKLSHKKKKKLLNGNKDQIVVNIQEEKLETNQVKKMIKKLTRFIQKMQQTLKKILHQKDVKWYIQYAHTSESEIIDSITNSLNKFKELLYQLKENSQFTGSLNYVSFQSSPSEKLLSTFHQSQKKQQSKISQKKINLDVLSFVIQYFQDHMVPQTHWSKKQQKNGIKQDFFTKYFSKFRMSCKTQIQQQQNNQSQLHLQKTMTQICQQIDKQQQQNLFFNNPSSSNASQKFLKKPVEQTLNALLKIQELKQIQKMTPIQKIAYLLDLQSKIFVSSQFIESAAYFQDDITTLSRENYKNVWTFINQNDLGDVNTINQQYKMMKMLMIITNASVIRQLQATTYQNSWFKKLVFGLSFPRYFLDFGRARLQNHKFLRKPTVNMTKSIWNLPQNGLIKQIKKPFIFQSIKCNIQFYIPRSFSTNLNNIKSRIFDPNIDIFNPNQNSIRIRLLNFKQLDKGNRKGLQEYDTIIIHYHGGGFIALSSCTSQTYTRKWANKLKVPIFSVDYGKPPQFRFPIPVLDCLQSYKFITTQIHKYFNIRPKKIIVTGDSAGGNLACALTGLIIKLQLKIPHGLFLAYPAVDTRTKFTPSRINSFNDVILYPTLLILCMQQYLGDVQKNQDNPLASPIMLSEEYVSDAQKDSRWPLKWPKSIIVVGKKDPLYDDSLRLCQRLASSNIQFHCEIYKNLSHAFLSIDKMVPECAGTINDSIKFFEILISDQKIGKKKLL